MTGFICTSLQLQFFITAHTDLRLPFLSPPTNRRATVEVFDPASKGFITALHECAVSEMCMNRCLPNG
jgi:hypothetical protein